MLFGSRNALGIEISPLDPTWPRRYAAEKSTWAALRVWAKGSNLCRHTLPGTEQVIDALNVPLAPIANWLVQSWLHLLFEERPSLFAAADRLHGSYDHWGVVAPHADVGEDAWYDARELWWARHFIQAGADGAHLPDLALARDDEKLLLDWARPSRITNSDPEFVAADGCERVNWDDAEDTLALFVKYVVDSLRYAGLSDLYSWVRLDDPLRELPKEVLTTLPLYTGRSEQELLRLTGAQNSASLPRALGLPDDANDPAVSPVTQTLRDLPAGMPPDLGDALSILHEKTAEGDLAPLTRFRNTANDARRGAESLKDEGYLAATALREEIGLDGTPIDDVGDVLRLLEVHLTDSHVSAKNTRMITGLREGQGAAAVVLNSRRTRVKWGHRFEQARALGHLLLDPTRGGALGAASSSFPTGSIRRRRSGAFAAEFLLPKPALAEATDGSLDKGAEPQVFENLMARFGVGATTAAYHLWNHGFLSSTLVRDELIEQYASGSE